MMCPKLDILCLQEVVIGVEHVFLYVCVFVPAFVCLCLRVCAFMYVCVNWGRIL